MAINIKYEVQDDDILHIWIDLKQEFGPSQSGKSTIIAQSEGNVTIYDKEGMRQERFNMTVSRKRSQLSGYA